MRLRSKTRFRIVLALAMIGPIAWTLACTIAVPARGDWPWPPGMRGADAWVPDAGRAKIDGSGRMPALRNTRTGEVVETGGGEEDKTEINDDGTRKVTKSQSTLFIEGEANVARMSRIVVFVAGLPLSFLMLWLTLWLALWAARRSRSSRPGHAARA